MNLYFTLLLCFLIISGYGAELGLMYNGNVLVKNIVIWILFVIWLSILIYSYFKYLNVSKKSVNEEYGYYRDIPGKYGPEILGYLLTYKDIKTEYMIASIMELIRRGIFVVYEKDDGSFVVNDNDKDNLKEMSLSEKYLKNWLINSVGNGVSFNNDDLYISIHDEEKLEKFNASFKEWSNIVISLGEKEKFFVGQKWEQEKSIGIYLMLNFGILYMFLGHLQIDNDVIYSTMVVFSLVALAVVFSTIKFSFTENIRTLKGKNEYNKWMGFKNFIIDFSDFENKEILDVFLWQKYLVYASVLGITDKVNFKLDINEVGISIDNDHTALVLSNVIERKISLIILGDKSMLRKSKK